MNHFRTNRWILVLLALLLAVAMAGCKGESSPTAPPITSGGGSGGSGSGGTTTPPSGATVTLTVSNATPVVDSSATITATVSLNNTAVANGTAVEFQTDLGTFQSGADVKSIIRTTTNGVTSVTLTSSAIGVATITATVNNVTKATKVEFLAKTVPPTQPSTAPTITGVTPAIGSPVSQQIVTITGTNFRAPLRVLFDPGTGAAPIEVPIVSFTDSTIQVITPKINITTDQQAKYSVTVITQQGTTTEQRVSLANAFTFQNDVLTPAPTTTSPASGPIDGGTRVTIFGTGFQFPVQVFFGNSEAQVISINYDKLIVISPEARKAGVTTGTVDIRIINVNSAKTATLSAGFRYADKISISAAGPTEGLYTGGTRVTIDGSGFDDPVAVVIGGVAANVIRVAATQIIAVTNPVQITNCSEPSQAIQVVNINNGESATGPIFIYRVPKPSITSVTPAALGGSTQITVFNAAGTPRFVIGGVGATVTGSVTNSNGTTTYTVLVPTTLKLDVASCAAAPGASAPQPTAFDVIYTSLDTGCTDTSPKGLTASPPNTPVLTLAPAAFAPFSATITPATAGPPAVPATVKPSAPQTVNITNTGAGTLTVNSITVPVTAACGRFNVSPNGAVGAVLSQCDAQPVIVTYSGQTAPVADQCTITINTTAGTRNLTLVGTSQ
jgi:hypothetical protein